MADKSKGGIVLAPYGSLYSPALATYERIVQVYEKEFSGYEIRLAFTSYLMRKRLSEKTGINVPGLLGALQELQDLAKELGVGDLVDIRPPLPLQEVPAAMSRASVGVFTPHLDVHIDMALSLKVPEFVAMDVPVVAVRTSIMTSLFREDEVAMFPDGDMQAFADWLARLHDDPSQGDFRV